jgi:hypothetical protein
MTENTPFDREIFTEVQKHEYKPLPKDTPQEEIVDNLVRRTNEKLEEMDVNKKVVNSGFHNFLIGFFIFIIISGIIVGVAFFGYGVYNDKFKSIYNNTNTCNNICPEVKLPQCPTCNPTTVCNMTFPSTINIKMLNSS